MSDTTREDKMALLQQDGLALHRSQPTEHHLGRQLHRIYEAMPMPEDPQLAALIEQLTVRLSETRQQD
ncbi:hypothetical protein SQ03_17470 [Methylobacterium platani JCM 14648]|uniref:Uncharacterized protein n=3 Tax=Methylobacterium platani TaxID=427683 RepID=A0A179SBE2_9HYPH|nr:hypothetical protein SQ03_17470 [Methylobacterium platani JCM 14648]OAS25114.1 hypothetical protein A5481_11520 [Methylobacterium platani]